MPALHILVADDQIPPGDVPEQDFRNRILGQFGDNPHTRGFVEQCAFMGETVQALRDSGYRVTAVRTYNDARKEISRGDFDLAIIDLGWYMDDSIPEQDRPAAGWSLCEQLDAKDERTGKKTPQILFSSRFPSEPELSREAARRQKLPIFKEATAVVRNSLMAAVGFVEATLSARRSAGATGSSHFEQELQNIALSLFKEPLREHRRWAFLTLLFVGFSLALLAAGVVLVYAGAAEVATLTSVTSLVSGTISSLLYRRLGSSQRALQNLRSDVLKQLQAGIGKAMSTTGETSVRPSRKNG
jgi:CheY-like chemotaxis protein